MAGTIFLVYGMLRIMTEAVAVYGAQRAHLRMLEQEKVRMEYLIAVCGNNDRSQKEHEFINCRKLLIGMIDMIEKRDIIPKIMGIHMKPRVFIAFVSYVCAAMVTFLARVAIYHD